MPSDCVLRHSINNDNFPLGTEVCVISRLQFSYHGSNYARTQTAPSVQMSNGSTTCFSCI